MFFLLSKLLNFLLSPMVWILLLILLGLIFPKKSRMINMLALLTFLIFSNPLLSNYIMHRWEVDPIFKENLPISDVGIILSGTLNGEIENKDQLHFQDAADRVTETISLYKNGLIQKVLISGGSGAILSTDFRESDHLKEFLMLCAIPAEDIMVDSESRNTYENAVYSKKLLQQHQLDDRSIVLITSAFHMKRALGCFQHQGIEVIPFAVDYRSTPVSLDITWVLPSYNAFATWNYLIKEWVGMIAYKLAGYL